MAEIQIHGNNATPDDDVRRLAGVQAGDPFSDALLATVTRRLESSGRFESVEVRKRFASISDSSRISLVIIVNDRAVTVEPDSSSGEDERRRGVRLRRRSVFGKAMVLPWLEYEDGYGLAYGAIVALPGVGGEGGRLSVPLTWGGRKRAAVEYERRLARGPVGRLLGGVARERRTNPAFEQDDDRGRVWGRIESRVKWNGGFGATVARERVSFAGEREAWRSLTLDATLDTRIDPIFPRNAIVVKTSRAFLSGERSGRINRTHAEVQGFLGVIGSPVVAFRLEFDGANRALPEYFQPLLGGWSSVRGFRAGSFHGDHRLVTSAELRVPVSSPLSGARVGFSLFVDRGKVFDEGTPASDEPWRTGYGAGVWASAAVLRFGVSVGHARGGGTRLTAGISLGR